MPTIKTYKQLFFKEIKKDTWQKTVRGQKKCPPATDKAAADTQGTSRARVSRRQGLHGATRHLVRSHPVWSHAFGTNSETTAEKPNRYN